MSAGALLDLRGPASKGMEGRGEGEIERDMGEGEGRGDRKEKGGDFDPPSQKNSSLDPHPCNSLSIG